MRSEFLLRQITFQPTRLYISNVIKGVNNRHVWFNWGSTALLHNVPEKKFRKLYMNRSLVGISTSWYTPTACIPGIIIDMH